MGLIRKKILFIDFREAYRSVFHELLDGAGYNVDVSASSEDALCKIRDHSYDLVITDLGLPGFDGLDLYLSAINIRSVLINRFLFIAGTTPEDLEAKEILTKLNKRFISKPFGINELLKNISSITGEKLEDAAWFAEKFTNRRFEKRFKWEEDCHITEKDSSVPKPFTSTIDISRNGVQIRYLGGPIKPDSMVELNIRYLKVKTPAKVVWSSSLNDMEATSGLKLLEPVNVSSILTVIQSARRHIPPLTSTKPE